MVPEQGLCIRICNKMPFGKQLILCPTKCQKIINRKMLLPSNLSGIKIKFNIKLDQVQMIFEIRAGIFDTKSKSLRRD